MPVTQPTPPTLTVKGRLPSGTNWESAFLMYVKGATAEEIATEMGIDAKKLKRRIYEAEWDQMIRLAPQLHLRAPMLESPNSIVLANAAERIKANREAAIKVGEGLRANIQATLDAAVANKVALDDVTIRNLSAAAARIDLTTMTALGDDKAPILPPHDPAKDLPVDLKGQKPVTFISINIPSVAQAPRVARNVTPTEQWHNGPEIPSVARDAVFGTSSEVPPDTIMEPEANGELVEIKPRTGGEARVSVDFTKLAAIISRKPPAGPKVSVPEIFKARP